MFLGADTDERPHQPKLIGLVQIQVDKQFSRKLRERNNITDDGSNETGQNRIFLSSLVRVVAISRLTTTNGIGFFSVGGKCFSLCPYYI
jgi:hypothetical protein